MFISTVGVPDNDKKVTNEVLVPNSVTFTILGPVMW